MNTNGNNFGPAALILALGLGIAAMIFASSPRARGAEIVTATVTAQLAGNYKVVLVNMNTGSKHPWAAKTWPDQRRCDAALGNANTVLRALADPNPNTVPADFDGADPQLLESLMAVVINVYQNTGKLPNLSISCELSGDPA